MFEKSEKYHYYDEYKQSKLANILFARELAKRLKDTSVTVNSLNPGLVYTRIDRHMEKLYGFIFTFFKFVLRPLLWLVMKSPKEGAQSTIHLAVSPELSGVTGLYFSDCKEEQLLTHALNDEDCIRMWKLSEEYVKDYLK